MGKSTVMEALHADHRNFVRVLEVLDDCLGRLRANQSTDLNLIVDALDYLEHYGSYYHHPKEDVIYRYHLEKHNKSWKTIDQLLDDHERLSRRTDELRVLTEGLTHDLVMRREKYTEQLSDFLKTQREHMMAEERYVFPMLEKAFTKDDWTAIEERMPTRNDPVFSEDVAVQYQALYQRVVGGDGV